MSDIQKQMDRIYGEVPPEQIPWNMPQPPQMLVDAVESGRIKPCRAIDLGCGAGNYSVWLAQQGFQVTGLDISPQAVSLAKNNAADAGVKCEFTAADLLKIPPIFHEIFSFAFEWEVLHHIFPKDREAYLANVHRLLVPGGLYFSVCFSERDAAFGGKGKSRTTPLGTELYFSSEQELLKLFHAEFSIIELSTIEIPGKYEPHMAVAAWLQKA